MGMGMGEGGCEMGCFDEICIKLRLIVTGFVELCEILNFMCILMAERQPRLWLSF